MKTKREPTIALINIVFLMLVFFMVAGTLAPPLDSDISLVNTEDLDGRAPPNALVLHMDGRLTHRGAPITDLADFLAAQPDADAKVLRLVPDQSVPARLLVAHANSARAAGAQSVFIITERGLK